MFSFNRSVSLRAVLHIPILFAYLHINCRYVFCLKSVLLMISIFQTGDSPYLSDREKKSPKCGRPRSVSMFNETIERPPLNPASWHHIRRLPLPKYDLQKLQLLSLPRYIIYITISMVIVRNFFYYDDAKVMAAKVALLHSMRTWVNALIPCCRCHTEIKSRNGQPSELQVKLNTLRKNVWSGIQEEQKGPLSWGISSFAMSSYFTDSEALLRYYYSKKRF